MKEKEKIFSFKVHTSDLVFKEEHIAESKLEDKHINLLCGEMIKQYENMPKLSQQCFKMWLFQC